MFDPTLILWAVHNHDMALTSGSQLGPYEIDSLLGAGGMGEVYRARDQRIDRDVAIKILPVSFAQDGERLHRFEQEARTIAALNHPNLVTIHDVGEQDGASFIVMELLDGETLREKLREGRLPSRKAIDYGVQIARGLAVAHERGIVHRDLKPENIIVTRDGRIKILDFGLAKVSGPAGDDIADDRTAYRDTTPGTVLGTVGYMAPEQVRGQIVDARTDIFSLGAILYESLSGGRAFQRESNADTMSAILKEDPPELTDPEMKIAPAVDRIVRRCLEKNPEERFHSAHDVAFALEAVSGTSASGVGVEAIIEPKRTRVLQFATAAMVLLAIAAIAFLAGRARAPQAIPQSVERLRLTQMTFQRGVEIFPSISPDGTSIAYVSFSTPGNADIYVQRAGGENAVNLTGENTADDFQPAFSPDGRSIAYRANGDAQGIYVMGATGESRRRLTDFGFNPSWTPDGASLLVATEGIWDPMGRATISSLHRIDVSTGETQKIESDVDAVQPSSSPNGRRIAFWGLPTGTGKRVLYTIPMAGGKEVPLTDDRYFNWNPVWSPDGAHLYFSSDRGGPMNLWRIPIDEESGVANGPPQRVTVAGQSHRHLGITRNGQLVFAASGAQFTLERYPFDPRVNALTNPEQIVSTSRQIWGAQASPDGQWLALKMFDAQEDLFVARSDGSGLRRLTNDEHKDRQAVWGPDSEHIYFFSDRSGRYEIWSIHRDGSSLEQVTRSTGENPGDPILAPDGKSLVTWYFTGIPGKTAARIDLSKPIEQRTPDFLPPIDPETGFYPMLWSPDGARIAGLALRLGGDLPADVHVYSVADATYQRVSDFRWLAGWLPDSRTLLVGQGEVFHLLDVETGALREWASSPGNRDTFVLSPDGKWLYSIRSEDESDIWMISEETVMR